MRTNKDILKITSNTFFDKRTELGLTQEKMAEKLKICRRAYQHIESGERCPSLETYSNLVSISDFDALGTLSSISKISQETKE
ncbi:MAG: helix-turn-helix domain-containing protein [Eubacterium sp.]|nr:helix-turn-helix domain-containing protein [Eubacterium sp.]